MKQDDVEQFLFGVVYSVVLFVFVIFIGRTVGALICGAIPTDEVVMCRFMKYFGLFVIGLLIAMKVFDDKK